jgi:uncharacterized protein YqeY
MPALKAKDTVRLTTLRSLVTMMTNEVVAKKRKPDEFLTDEEALVVHERRAHGTGRAGNRRARRY